MRRRMLLILAVVAAPLAVFLAPPPAQSAPPGPQCSIRECGPPTDLVRKIVDTCKYAYCQFP